MSRHEIRRLRPKQGGRMHAPVFPIHGIDPLGFPNPSPEERARLTARDLELEVQRKRLVGCMGHVIDGKSILTLGLVERVDVEHGVIRAYGNIFHVFEEKT